jgi:transposase-like protein
MWPEISRSVRAFFTGGCARVRKRRTSGAEGCEPEATDEVRRLRREITRLKLENDILKKAAVILGTKPQPGDER